MPELHKGTDVEIPDNVPLSRFRNAIPNPKRYMKHNNVSISDVSEAAYTGDIDLLQDMLATGDEKVLYNGDVNVHVNSITSLMMASMAGQTECVELLLKAKADPHVRETMKYGQDPEDGRTAVDFAKGAGFDDITKLLEQAQKKESFGWYLPAGKTNNAKAYGCWQFDKKPEKGFYSKRLGAAELAGFDPMKYGTGPLPEEDVDGDYAGPGMAAPTRPALTNAPAAALPAIKYIPVGLLFPGQGSQYVGMLKNLTDIPKVAAMCKTAKEILGWDVLELCLKGPEDKLQETRYCQPCMYIAGLAGLEKLRADRKEAVDCFKATAGLSLGEYTALCAAGVLTFEDGLRLVKLRGEAMQQAAESSPQQMLSVAGLEKDKLLELCKESAKKAGPKEVCKISNELFPKGFSCGGTKKAIDLLKKAAEDAGALQAKMLKTSGAFHTELMQPAKETLAKALDEVLPRMQPPRHTVYMNSNAKPVKPGSDPKAIVQLLKDQLTNPVLWEPTVRKLIAEEGIKEFYEVGPMKQLKAMMKRIDAKMWNTTQNVEV